ncbi:MAG: hypothetical protein PHH54_06060 [Candidatus Nanoarchaeia archaeon]|nr:hypothetical protein [Candidatus Nanoarchaeia archaeon]MDD5741519.1 hypothetical protein [Candidatus Nanoarchaeia archaeon]
MDKRLVADTSFYSFFVNDTSEKDSLGKILNDFKAEMPPKVYSELKASKNPEFLDEYKDKINLHNSYNLSFNAILKPLFSKEQEEKGEHEVIVVALFCYNLKLDFVFIIDDGGAFKFIEKNFPDLIRHVKRTASFICDCCTIYKIFNKPESLDLLEKMGNSKFFIDKITLCRIKEDLKKHD